MSSRRPSGGRRVRPVVGLVLTGLSLSLLGACASAEDATSQESSGGGAGACSVTVSDPWVKATDTEMTGAFGVLTNTGSAEVTVVSASSPAADLVEIHEVVDKDGSMVMQPKAGGLVIPAGRSATLKPGGDHIMLMKLPEPIEAGAEVSITATCASGGEVSWTGVAKPFEGGAESYEPSPAAS